MDPITVQIDPSVELPNRYLGSDEDGPMYGPVTLYDAVVDAAARKIAATHEKKMHDAITVKVDEAIAALLEKRLPIMVDETLDGPIVVTDEWGGTKSTGTLREQIVKHAQSQLVVSGRSSYSRETILDKAIQEHIGYSLSRELAEAVKAAKQKLLNELTKQTSESLSKAIYNGVTAGRA